MAEEVKKEAKIEEKKEKEEKKPVGKVKKTGFDAYRIIKHPLSTEKSIRLMEAENKLIFVVDKDATKASVKRAIEELFKVKVVKVNTLYDQKGRKRAYVKLHPESPAIDIATDMGLM